MGNPRSERPQPAWRRAGVVVAAAVIGGLAIAPALASAPDRAGVPFADQRPGRCHAYATTIELWAPSDSAPAVSCSTAHHAETVALAPLPDTVASESRRPSASRLRQVAAALPCSYVEVRDHVGSDIVNPHWFLLTEVRFPTSSAWEAGERRYRCDIAVEGAAPPHLVAPVRTGSLRSLMDRPESAAIRPCLAGGGLVPCSQPHDAELFGSGVPTEALASVEGRALYETGVCPRLAETFLGGSPKRLRLRTALVDVSPGQAWCALRLPEAGPQISGTLAAQAAGSGS